MFLYKLAEATGWDIDYSGIDSNQLMAADINAFYGETEKLKRLIEGNIQKINDY